MKANFSVRDTFLFVFPEKHLFFCSIFPSIPCSDAEIRLNYLLFTLISESNTMILTYFSTTYIGFLPSSVVILCRVTLYPYSFDRFDMTAFFLSPSSV